MGKHKKKSGKKSHQNVSGSADADLKEKRCEQHEEMPGNINADNMEEKQTKTLNEQPKEESNCDSEEQKNEAPPEKEERHNMISSQSEMHVTNQGNPKEFEQNKDGEIAPSEIETNGSEDAQLSTCSNENLILELRQEIKALKLELEAEKKEKEKIQESNPDTYKTTENELQEELVNTKKERNDLELQYNTLLSRISSMKTVFNKMKESQEELSMVKEQLEEYESQNIRLKGKVEILSKERKDIETTVKTVTKEYSDLDNMHSALQDQCREYREEIDSLSLKLETCSNEMSKESELCRKENSQLKSQIEELMIVLNDNKHDITLLKDEKRELLMSLENSTTEKTEIQDSLNKMEVDLEKTVKSYEESIEERKLEVNSLRSQLDNLMESSKESSKTIQDLEKNIEIMREDVLLKEKFEKECKDRVLQIGKLRHEAIILNEHLTKALSMLKQSSDSESVDKELISNLLISFVAIPRADPRKFEVLELISSFLSWDDDKKRQAGLIHSNDSNRKSSGSSTENFVSMWTDFLEKESESK